MLGRLEKFIVAAKRQTYVGDGKSAEPCRMDAHDLSYDEGEWTYRDSYFGGTDFLGQETVWMSDKAVWAMNYYGYILRGDLIDAEKAGAVIKAALSALYAQDRFLGGFDLQVDKFIYQDKVDGDHTHFHGIETISLDGVLAYELRYHGGLVKN